MFALCSCRRWVQTSRREDLRSRSVDYLHANCKLCADHFEDNQFMNAVTRSKLIWNAVPTIFTVPNPPKRLASTRRPPLKRSNADLEKRVTKRRRDCMFIKLSLLQTYATISINTRALPNTRDSRGQSYTRVIFLDSNTGIEYLIFGENI